MLPPGVIALAELRSAEAGLSAEQILIAEGRIAEETYIAALAHSLGLEVERLDHRQRETCPLADARLIEAARTGLLPLNAGSETAVVVAPVLVGTRRFILARKSGPGFSYRVRITSTARLQRFVARHAEGEIGTRAANALRIARPELSAAPWGRAAWLQRGLVAATAAALLTAPEAALFTAEVLLGVVFLAWGALRVVGAMSGIRAQGPKAILAEHKLPIYTIVIALYQEAAAVKGLVQALQKLNYPKEKLDIKLVLEPDDRATLAAVDKLRLGWPIEVLVAPDHGPRTKPKALNAALLFARGEFIAIFDAEDRPEPDQIRLALESFLAGDGQLACVQARLTIDNTADSWLSRLFTAEYAGLFDVLLPGLAAWRLPLPLGGSSNHFRTSILRKVGAWDPYNVTEDADLGMRLARFGYRTAVIRSTTYEEAPARFGPWLKQRTRWFKGWVQTWLVHMRSPRALAQQLGLRGFAAFQLLVGGTVLAALVHPLFAIEFMVEMAMGTNTAMLGFYLTTLVVGYAVSAALGAIGLARRGLLASAWVLVLIPVYWMLLSAAAWRAVFQLVQDPYRWEKTEHGLARTSRLAERAASGAT